jgi:signal peptidase I
MIDNSKKLIKEVIKKSGDILVITGSLYLISSINGQIADLVEK